MHIGVYIPGGMVRLDAFGKPFPTEAESPIEQQHTAYEWAMALGADINPYAPCLADGWGPRGLLKAPTIEGMKARESLIEDWVDETGPEVKLRCRDIYLTFRTEFDAGHLKPQRLEWCIDRPGIDPPKVLDFSRCVFGIEQVLPLVQRRGDTGWVIERLARSEATACTSLSPGADNGGKTKERRPRRDAKRPEIVSAISALTKSTAWGKASDKERCRLVERHLNKDEGWCSVRTLGRAIKKHAEQQPIE